jgi:hypothetical protein
MSVLRQIAITLIVIAIIMTSVGGLTDFLQNDYRITKRHAWNDGIFLVMLAIALILLDIRL